jgi:tetratricopeptide (TPR) repeat protein
MSDPQDIEQQQELLRSWRQTLVHQQRRRAMLGEAHTPPEVAHGIAEARAAIGRIKATLRGWGAAVDDHPDDEEAAAPELSRALASLAALPLDRLPEHGSLPRGSRMPYSLNNLGALLRAMGDLEGARAYYEQALDIRRAVLGERHPDTANSLNNLAMLCFDEGKHHEAAALMRQALAIREEVLGPQHPSANNSRRNLAAIEARLAQGDGGAEEH